MFFGNKIAFSSILLQVGNPEACVMKHGTMIHGMAGGLVLVMLAWAPGAQAAEANAVAATTAATNAGGLPINYDATPLDRTNSQRVTSYADVLDKVVPAVVSVYTTINVPQGMSRQDQMQQLLRRYYGTNPQQQQDSPANTDTSGRPEIFGVGSGSILTADGYILTNRHVIVGPRQQPVDGIHVKLQDGREFDAKLVGSDEKTDIALLKIATTGLPTMKLADSDKLRVGDIVFAVGNPMDVGFTVTHGIISATGRSSLRLLDDQQAAEPTDRSFEDFIQTDASINEGNSGGPLVDAQGRLVGMDSAIMSTRAGGSIGIGFAIPSSLLRQVIRDLTAYGAVRRGFLGVEIQDLNHDLAQAMGLNSTHGALVNNVNPELPAGAAGVQRGDVVVKVNDQDVDTADKLRFLVASNEPGATVALTVLRGGGARVISVKLGDRDALNTESKPLVTPTSRFNALNRGGGPGVSAPVATGPLAGLTLEAVTPGLRGQYNLPGNLSGLVVTNVDNNSPYADQFTAGMVVEMVNGKAVSRTDQVQALLKPGAVNVLYVYNDGHFGYMTVLLPGQK